MVMGRPKKLDNERRSNKIDFRVSDDILHKLEECKEALGCTTKSEVIVKAIELLHSEVTNK